MIIWIFLAILYVLIGYLAFNKARKVIKYYKQVYPHIQQIPNQQWKAFIREDKHSWNQKQIFIGCFLKFPFKLIIFVQYIIGCFIITILTVPFGAIFSNKILRVYGRYYGTYLFKLIWNINEPQGINKTVLKTPILISNHVCWIDTMYLIVTFYPISFLSKAEVAKIPLFGHITTNAQSIYLQRGQQKARQKISKDIKQRVTNFLQKAKQNIYQQVYPLIIFPQGTTSNGKSLLRFKMGAFNDLSPLTVISLNYECDRFDCGMVELTMLEHFIFSLCLKLTLNVKMSQIQPNKNQKPQQYCQRAQQVLSQMTGFKRYNTGFRQRQQYGKLLKQIMLNKNKSHSQ